MIKAMKKLGMEDMYLNRTLTKNDNPVTNIVLNEEKLNAFSLK
jgi:hypothetical protein